MRDRACGAQTSGHDACFFNSNTSSTAEFFTFLSLSHSFHFLGAKGVFFPQQGWVSEGTFIEGVVRVTVLTQSWLWTIFLVDSFCARDGGGK